MRFFPSLLYRIKLLLSADYVEDAQLWARKYSHTLLKKPLPLEYPQSQPPIRAKSHEKQIWVHLANEDELASLSQFLHDLASSAKASLLITGVSEKNASLIARDISPSAHLTDAPIEGKRAVRLFLKNWQPDICIWTGQNFAPRLFYELKHADIPLIWLRASITSQKKHWSRFFSRYYREIFNKFSAVLCENYVCQRMIISLGASADIIHVIGECQTSYSVKETHSKLRSSPNTHLKNRQIWLAKDIPQVEILTIIKAYQKAKRKAYRLLLAIHSHSLHFPFAWEGLNHIDMKNINAISYDTDVILVEDADLSAWLRLSPFCYAGGTLTGWSGSNPMEAASLGSALIAGPHQMDYHEEYKRLIQKNALYQINEPEELADAVSQLIAADKAALLARNAWDVATEGAEFSENALNFILTTANIERLYHEAS